MSNQDLPAPRGQWAGLTLERQLMLWGLTFAAITAILYYLSSVLTPFVAGLALGYLLDPVADRLQAMGFSRLGAALLLLLVFILVVVAAVLLLLPVLSRQFAGFITSLPGYIITLEGLLAEWSERLTADYNGVLQKFGLGGAGASLDIPKYLHELMGDGSALIGDFLKSVVSRGVALINIASLIVVTPVVAFYILLDWDEMLDVLDKLVPPRHRDDVRMLAGDIDRALAGFLRGQSAVCLFLGSWYALGLSVIGLNFGFLIGVVAGVSELHSLCRLDHGLRLVDHRRAGAGLAALDPPARGDRHREPWPVSRRQCVVAAARGRVGGAASGVADVRSVRLRLLVRLHRHDRRRAGRGVDGRRVAFSRGPLSR